MQNNLSFFLDVSNLKTMRRTGWVWRGVQNPETVAEHSFRTALFAWVLGSKTSLNVGRMMEMALFHDICEVYIGDLTPFFGILPKNKNKRKAMLLRWIRLPQKQKIMLSRKRVALEKKALSRLLRLLPPTRRREVSALWDEYENGLSQEGRFVKQIDKIEAMLQAVEYFGTASGNSVVGWWEEVEELVDHPVLKDFVKSIEHYFYDKRKAKLQGEIVFLVDAGRTKRNPKKAWIMQGLREPDSAANHMFLLAIMCWVFARGHDTHLNIEKLLKMSLLTDLYAASAEQINMYDDLRNKAKTQETRQKIMEKWVRRSRKEKEKIFRTTFKYRKAALKKLTASLDAKTRRDMLSLWEESQMRTGKDAYFFGQVRVLSLLLQALRYWEENKRFPIKPWWEWAFEHADSKLAADFMATLKHRFVTHPNRQKKGMTRVS